MIVTKEMYRENMDSNEGDSFLELNLKTAQNIIETKLGYKLEEADVVFTYDYQNSRGINLGHYQVNTIGSVKVNGQLTNKYSKAGYYLILDSELSIKNGDKIEIEMNVGFTSANCPEEIILAIMYVAQSLQKNKGNGGYATQANFGQGSITIDTTRYKQYFDLINSFRVFSI